MVHTSTNHPETFSQWFVKAYPLTPFICFILYAIALFIIFFIGIVRYFIGKTENTKLYIDLTEALLLIVHGSVILIELYKNFMEYMETVEHRHNSDKFENFTNNDSDELQVILIKADWCPSCKMFLNSGVWENIQTEILSITNDNSISFVEFDVAKDDPNLISKVLMIDSNTIPYVPSIYIKTPEGVFFYQDNIYNSKNMIQVLKSLLQKFNFLEE